MSTTAYTQNRRIEIPDLEIEKDDASYVHVPLRGYSVSLAVFDVKDECIGYIHASTLGYPTVKEWMAGVNWKDQGY